MANFHDGGLDTFHALTFSQPHPSTLQFIDNLVNQPSNALSQAGSEFMDRARDVYQQVAGSEAMRRMRGAMRQVASSWERDVIRPLRTVADLQTAPNTMRRWLMAEPTIRHLYHKGRCDGYSDTYRDREPDAIGENHYDYRRVMNGIVNETEEGFFFTEYLEDIYEGEHEFLAEEQFDIVDSWFAMAANVASGEDDPTSKWNAKLG
tara:strand:+ start:1979 stop:2596 length:618 start_codon:yes stop_codon:yes gene_type:complete